ncbi:Pfs NACHT and ankyrin domain protein [Penicillium subrubescens]|uniref:Pfs NACHT and ankyrin domain protein n=1 Tax=Penicillium subrubescens TaxID=1316194 RepID=UPI002544E918|nr:Pfs NACHT and ankyrin domain protein [Penicillium subrubescens]KAJ5884121.1 Pfs NACHT and ankyrin domain protein [Penicillium subrubescens]
MILRLHVAYIETQEQQRSLKLKSSSGDLVRLTTGGICQYDLIKAKSSNKRKRKGFLGRPPTVLLDTLASI